MSAISLQFFCFIFVLLALRSMFIRPLTRFGFEYRSKFFMVYSIVAYILACFSSLFDNSVFTSVFHRAMSGFMFVFIIFFIFVMTDDDYKKSKLVYIEANSFEVKNTGSHSCVVVYDGNRFNLRRKVDTDDNMIIRYICKDTIICKDVFVYADFDLFDVVCHLFDFYAIFSSVLGLILLYDAVMMATDLFKPFVHMTVPLILLGMHFLFEKFRYRLSTMAMCVILFLYGVTILGSVLTLFF